MASLASLAPRHVARVSGSSSAKKAAVQSATHIMQPQVLLEM